MTKSRLMSWHGIPDTLAVCAGVLLLDTHKGLLGSLLER